MRRDGFQDKWVVCSRSLNAIVLIVSVAFGPMASQLIVQHEHGDVADHVHRVPVEELSIWYAVHAHLHESQTTEPDRSIPISQDTPDTTMELMDTGTLGTVILVNVTYMIQSSSRSMEASITQLSPGTSMVYTGCSGNLQDLASRPPGLSGHPPSPIAQSLMTAILRTNHTLLV